MEQAYGCMKKKVALCEMFPEQLNERVLRYLGSLNNLLIAQRELGKEEEFLSGVQKMKSLPEKYPLAKSEDIRIKIFERAYLLELLYYSQTGQFEKAIDVVKNVDAKLRLWGKQISQGHLKHFYYEFMYAYFGCNNFSMALKWNNKIINETEPDIREDLHCFAKILNILIHYELGHEDLLPYLIQSTQRFLAKRNRLHKFENSMMSFFKSKWSQMGTQKEAINSYKEFKEELIEIFKDPVEKEALGYFDLLSWVQSKMEGRPFSEIVKERYQKRGK